jgi:hypothetical protein
MAIITQFATDPALITMMDKHHAWHTGAGAHGHPPRTFPIGTPGSGLEFFQFHRDLNNEFFAWNAVNGAATAAEIAAWTAIPAELKLPETGWPNPGFGSNLADAEARINSNTPPFADEDALGIHVETTIHNWIHGAVAASSLLALPAAEKTIIAGFHSPQSTYFYKIHGLVQYWWDRWLHPKLHIKEIIDHKFAIKDLQDQKLHIKDIIDRHGKPHIKDIKEKDIKDIKEKDVFEGGKHLAETFDPRERIEQKVIQQSVERLIKLEASTNRKRSPFIKPFMRPDVGHSVAKAAPTRAARKKR